MVEKKENSKKPWVNPDDSPEWTDEMFERAEFSIGDKVIREATGTLTKAGRPKLKNPKQQVTLRLDKIVLEKFKSMGAGWQTRINEELRKALNL